MKKHIALVLLLCPLIAFPFENVPQWRHANDTSKLELVVFVEDIDSLAYLKECQHISDKYERYNCSEKLMLESTSKYFFEHYSPRCVFGTIYVQFTVSKEGRVINSKIARGIASVEDALALEAINNLSEFVPAYLNGEKVETTYFVPIQLLIK